MAIDLTNCTLIKSGSVFNLYTKNDSEGLIREKKPTDLNALLLIEPWEQEFLEQYFQEHGLKADQTKKVIDKIVANQRSLD